MSKLKNSIIAKVFAGLVGVMMAVVLTGGVAVLPAQAQTVEELQAQITQLLGLISQLQAQLNAQAGGASSTSGFSHTWTKDLSLGSTGPDVTALQKALNSNSATQVAASGAGSAGNETSSFGPLTKAAVIKYQNLYASSVLTPVGLTQGTGYVGAATRAHLNSKFSGVAAAPAPAPAPAPTPAPTTGTTGTTGDTTPAPAPVVVPAGTGLSVSKATQPSDSLAPQSAARVPFTRVTFTAGADGDVTVNSIVVERGGLAADAAFAGVVLLDEGGVQLGVEKTFNSDHRATVGDSFVVKAGTSRTLTIAGNMAADNSTRAGQVATLSLVGVNTSATVSGSLPVSGAAHTINASLSIGSVTMALGPRDPNSSQNKEIGTKAYTFSAVKVTAGSVEKVRIMSVRWNQSGSAAKSDLANVKTYIDATEYSTIVSSDGKYYTSNFGDKGVLIDKGNSVEIYVKGDIVGGSSRTVDFDLYRRTDLYVVGDLYGYGITPPNGTDTSGTDDSAFHSSTNPWYDASQVTNQAGSITVEKDVNIAAQNIAVNLSEQPLGGFVMDVKGEPVSVAQQVYHFLITGTGGQVADVTNATLYDETGAAVAGPADGSGAAASGTVTFSDTVVFPTGRHSYRLKGKLGTDFTNSQTIQASTTPSSDWTTVTGQNTGDTITPSPSSAVTANTMTVRAAAITISVSSLPAAQSVVAGTNSFLFANYQFDATGSGENIKFSTIPLETSVNSGSGNITNCQLFDGTTALNTGTNIVTGTTLTNSSSTSFTFDSGLTITKGTVKTIGLKCNIAAAASGVYQFGYDGSASPTATGLTSGQSATITEVDSSGQRMTIQSGGTLAVTLDSSSPSYAIGAGGATDNLLSVLRFTATFEDVRLEEVALQLTNTGSSTASDVTKVTLWDGATQVGEAIFTGTNTLATSTITGTVVVPKNGDKLLTVKGNFAEQGLGKVGRPGTLVAVDWDGTALIGTTGIGQSSGTTVEAGSATGSDTASQGVRVYRSYPTLALVPLATTKLVAGRTDLFRFKVTASPQGDIGIYHVTFRVATSSATVSEDMVDNVNVYAFTDSGFSTPVSGLSTTDGRMAQNHLPITGTGKTSSSDLVVGAHNGTASTTVVVPAGQTRYFAIRGDVTLAGTTYSSSVQLQGDATFVADTASAYPAGTSGTALDSPATYLATTTYILSTPDNDFIWRPFSTTTSQSVLANDYSTGYGILTLPTGNTDSQILTN